MSRLALVRIDYSLRYRLFVDSDAAEYTAFRVELFPHPPVVVGNPSMSEGERWREALGTASWLHSQPGQSLYPSNVFVPFARIIAVDHATESRELAIRNQHIIGDLHPDHEARVRALCTALDLIDGGAMADGRAWN